MIGTKIPSAGCTEETTWILYKLLTMEIDNRLKVMINIIFFRILLYFFIRSIIMPLYVVITIV
jgi:hypothetical protein